MVPPLQHRALCLNETDAPAPAWVNLPLCPTPYLCPARLHVGARPPKRRNREHGVSKRRKRSSAGGQGSDLKIRFLFGPSVTLSMTTHPHLSPHPLSCRGGFWSNFPLAGCSYSDLHNWMMILAQSFRSHDKAVITECRKQCDRNQTGVKKRDVCSRGGRKSPLIFLS